MEVPTAVERINLIKSVLAYLLDQAGTNVSSNNRKPKNCYEG